MRGRNPWQARVWREQGTGGTYADMDPDVRPDAPQPDDEPYPAEGSVTAVLDWVGDDLIRARYAFDTEDDRPRPRSGITAPLRRMLTG